jgi:transcriptional regulator with XRE-family HTH domain
MAPKKQLTDEYWLNLTNKKMQELFSYLGLSFIEIAERLGTNQATIRKWMSDKPMMPKHNQIMKICYEFQIDPIWWFDEKMSIEEAHLSNRDLNESKLTKHDQELRQILHRLSTSHTDMYDSIFRILKRMVKL